MVRPYLATALLFVSAVVATGGSARAAVRKGVDENETIVIKTSKKGVKNDPVDKQIELLANDICPSAALVYAVKVNVVDGKQQSEHLEVTE
ncbi:hypothetical protein GQ602_002006 [Ophiocordyceps camponoti-floridani]|uniref:Uncharacterized protein n=1 Tax=Ophiocordyceps camponoti-floridani TaxID=2030778 RepID=A0A8H4Q9L8_9HYPO|nr:hypothetical protein GQ602_002006 [Ophiocordyceps camponoti-floridani]